MEELADGFKVWVSGPEEEGLGGVEEGEAEGSRLMRGCRVR